MEFAYLLPKGGVDMTTRLYNLSKFIAALTEYQEVGALLLDEDEIKRCLSASCHKPAPIDASLECTHELITLHAGACDRCGAFFVRPIRR